MVLSICNVIFTAKQTWKTTSESAGFNRTNQDSVLFFTYSWVYQTCKARQGRRKLKISSFLNPGQQGNDKYTSFCSSLAKPIQLNPAQGSQVEGEALPARQASSSHNQSSLVLVSDLTNQKLKQIGRRCHCLNCCTKVALE